jgi:PAS domain-containing protein
MPVRTLFTDPARSPGTTADSVPATEADWRRRDGSIITVRLTGRAVRNRRGETVALDMIVEDVSDRRMLEDPRVRRLRAFLIVPLVP